MRTRSRLRFEVTALCGLTAALVATARCGDGGDTTGRVRVTFPVSVRGINPSADTSTGWHVVARVRLRDAEQERRVPEVAREDGRALIPPQGPHGDEGLI